MPSEFTTAIQLNHAAMLWPTHTESVRALALDALRVGVGEKTLTVWTRAAEAASQADDFGRDARSLTMPIPLRTETRLARRLGVSVAEIRRLIRTYKIQSVGVADAVAVFDAAAFEALRVAIRAERGGRP